MIGIGSHQMPVGKPAERHWMHARLAETALESTDYAPLVDVGRAKTALTDIDSRRRRIQQIGKTGIGGIGCEERRQQRCKRHTPNERNAHALHVASASRSRGSTIARSRSPASVPIARKNEPIAAQPATR